MLAEDLGHCNSQSGPLSFVVPTAQAPRGTWTAVGPPFTTEDIVNRTRTWQPDL
jgi:hypothetical protein